MESIIGYKSEHGYKIKIELEEIPPTPENSEIGFKIYVPREQTIIIKAIRKIGSPDCYIEEKLAVTLDQLVEMSLLWEQIKCGYEDFPSSPS